MKSSTIILLACLGSACTKTESRGEAESPLRIAGNTTTDSTNAGCHTEEVSAGVDATLDLSALTEGPDGSPLSPIVDDSWSENGGNVLGGFMVVRLQPSDALAACDTAGLHLAPEERGLIGGAPGVVPAYYEQDRAFPVLVAGGVVEVGIHAAGDWPENWTASVLLLPSAESTNQVISIRNEHLRVIE